MMRKNWTAGLPYLLPLALVAAACGGETGESPAQRRPVDVAVTSPVVSSGFMTLPATVVARDRAKLATRVSGTIRRMTVDVGARVRAGQPLAVLDTREIDARIRSAEAAARLARRWHERIAALARDGAATAQELDDARAKLDMAEAALRDARAQRDYFVLRAPFAGAITARTADPGDLAVPGVPILEMIGTGGLEIEADLPAGLAGRLGPGRRLQVFRPETGERWAAVVLRVAPAVERASRRFRVEARFEPDPAPPIAPGTYVRLAIDLTAAPTRWIPADAVLARGQLKGVFVIDGGELRLRWVRLGQRIGDAVELLALGERSSC